MWGRVRKEKGSLTKDCVFQVRTPAFTGHHYYVDSTLVNSIWHTQMEPNQSTISSLNSSSPDMIWATDSNTSNFTPGHAMLRRGSGPRPFSCDVCGKRFKLRHHLVEHYVVHDPTKAFVCTICHSSFKRNKELKYHTKMHHT